MPVRRERERRDVALEVLIEVVILLCKRVGGMTEQIEKREALKKKE